MIQPSQKGWQPKGAVSFVPEIIQNKKVKIDFQFDPSDLEPTWLGEMKTNGSSIEEFPFVQYIYEYITKRAIRDVNNCVINGVFVAPTTGVPGPALTSFNGLLKVYSNAITAGKIVPTTTGALTSTNIVNKVESVFDGVHADFREQALVLVMSPTHLRNYFRAKRGADFQNDLGLAANTMLDFTNCKIVAPQYMNGSNRIIVTLRENLLQIEDGVHEEEKLVIQQDKRDLVVLGNFKRGIGFGITTGYVWGNEQA
jgi:hypothetical protein